MHFHNFLNLMSDVQHRIIVSSNRDWARVTIKTKHICMLMVGVMSKISVCDRLIGVEQACLLILCFVLGTDLF